MSAHFIGASSVKSNIVFTKTTTDKPRPLQQMKESKIEMDSEGFSASFITLCIIVLLCLGLWGCPQWNVYQSRLSGEAQLAEAESNRKIAIAEAEAKKESAQALSDAEIIRAKGVAEANKIIGDSLKENEGYLRYLYIQSLAESETHGNKIIYIPTEAGLPILEAGRK